jgi:hypothetical protein
VDPLRDVRVTLQQETVLLTRSPGAVVQSAPPRTAVSDESGRFLLANVPPGLYTLTLEREGFAGSSTNASSLMVMEGETAEIRLSMAPGGVIRGRVLDSNGQFLTNATVQALSRVFHNGISSLQPIATRATDDRGEYRLFGIPAGDYFLSAMPRPTVARPASGTARDMRTFFPSAASITTATPVKLSVGEEIVGMDILLAARLQASISGRVVSDLTPPMPEAKAHLHLVPRDLNVPDDPGARAEVSVQLKPTAAEFEIPNVEPGAYDLFAIIDTPRGPAVGRISVNVIDSDVQRIFLIVQSGVTLRGTITVDGKPDSAHAAGLAIQAMDSMIRAHAGFGPAATGNEPGSFIVDGVPEGRFRIVPRLSAGLYVDDIQQGGQSIYDSGLNVRAGSQPDPLLISIKSGAGLVEGNARDDTGAPLPGATVALVPNSRRSNPALYQSVTTGVDGAFVLRNVTPGDYKIFAWQGAVAGTFYSREFLSQFEEYGLPVTVSPRSRSRADITVKRDENR